MLTKTSSIKQINKIKSSYTNRPWYENPTYIEHHILVIAKDVNDKAKKIIEQNEHNNNLLKENNELLRAIFVLCGRPEIVGKPNGWGRSDQDLVLRNNISKLCDKYKLDSLLTNQKE
jgi:hypothetical protein